MDMNTARGAKLTVTRLPGRRTASKGHAVPRYIVTVASAEPGNGRRGFIAAWHIYDRKMGLSYPSRHFFNDRALPRTASALIMAARSMANYARGTSPASVILIPFSDETSCVNSLFSLWKEGSDAFYAHEDYQYWDEIFKTFGPDSAFVTYLSNDLPTVSVCRRMFP